MTDRTLTTADFAAAAASLGCDVAAIKAVAQVEAPKGGFAPDGRPTILFEGHIFYRETKGRFAASHPTLCFPKWDRRFYAKTQDGEHARLAEAMKLDRKAALRSASWGKFQIMGFNHVAAGYDYLDAFVAAMGLTERHQLDAFVGFLKSQKLDAALREGRWKDFARGYNGPRYAENQYDVKLAAAHARYAKEAAA